MDEIRLQEALKKWQEEKDERFRRFEKGLCQNCGERPGTVNWGDALASIHGWTEKWCSRCAFREQLKHAWGRTKALPRLLFSYLREEYVRR